MRTGKRVLPAAVLLVLAVDGWPADAQPRLLDVPSFQEVEAAWKGFWGAVILGDLVGARKYVHSRRQHLFPGGQELKQLQAMADQMAHCRVDPTPFPLVEDVIYRVLCQRGGETAETQIGFRRDLDGVWRFSVL